MPFRHSAMFVTLLAICLQARSASGSPPSSRLSDRDYNALALQFESELRRQLDRPKRALRS
jgi:hypothetical protein